ncbi:hypothetical protein B0H10DRAFT_1957614 [Mycena sp. CBHHK59/15]|nr:hypothetical protein B0H10DRAFT_1957614 [Mycena sp. CBHHK59/15]
MAGTYKRRARAFWYEDIQNPDGRYILKPGTSSSNPVHSINVPGLLEKAAFVILASAKLLRHVGTRGNPDHLRLLSYRHPITPRRALRRAKMLRNAHEGFKHSRADQEYLDGCTARQLMDFRNDVFAAGFIERNPQLFLNYDWVDVPQLRAFLRQNTPDSGFDASTTRPSAIHDPPNIKIEPLAPSGPTGPRGLIKAEPLAISLPPPSAIKMRTVKENGCDVLVILSDSESESDIDDRDSDLEVIEALKHTSRSSSVIPPSGIEVLMFSYSAKYLLEAPDVESDFEEPASAKILSGPDIN